MPPTPLNTAPGHHALAYRPDIDGLRAIAVSAVLGFHLSLYKIPGGFAGVDVFFVISGFLISSIIYRQLQAGRFSIVEFYIRRVRRIFPALLIILIAAAIAGWMLLLPSDYIHLGKQIAGGSAFAANLVLWKQADYLAGSVAYVPLLHLWSLGIEEQFYLLFPQLCIVFYRARWKWALPLAFAAVALATMAANAHLARLDSLADFYMPYTRLWELLIGAGLSLHQHHGAGGRHHAAWHHLAGLTGAALLLGAFALIRQDFAFPGWWALLPCIGTALLIWAGPASWINKHVLSSRPFVYLGLISYPLYLWHWPILSFLRISHGYDEPGTPVWAKLVVIAVSLLLATLTFHLVEKPIRKSGGGRQGKLVIAGLLAGMALAGLFGLAVAATDGFPQRFPPVIAMLDHDYDLSPGWREGRCFLKAEQPASSFADDCVDPPNASSGASSGAVPLIVLWGDSHMADLYPGFAAMQPAANIRLAQFTASSCVPVIGHVKNDRPFCRAINDAVLLRIKALKPDLVVLSGLWWGMTRPTRPGAGESVAQGLAATIRSLKSFGVPRVVVIGQAPIWPRRVPTLLLDEVRAHPERKLPLSLPRDWAEKYDDGPLRAAAQQSGAVYVPIIARLCDAQSCQVTTGAGWRDVLTFDEAHFTTHGATFLVRRIWNDVMGKQEGMR